MAAVQNSGGGNGNAYVFSCQTPNTFGILCTPCSVANCWNFTGTCSTTGVLGQCFCNVAGPGHHWSLLSVRPKLLWSHLSGLPDLPTCHLFGWSDWEWNLPLLPRVHSCGEPVSADILPRTGSQCHPGISCLQLDCRRRDCALSTCASNWAGSPSLFCGWNGQWNGTQSGQCSLAPSCSAVLGESSFGSVPRRLAALGAPLGMRLLKGTAWL